MRIKRTSDYFTNEPPLTGDQLQDQAEPEVQPSFEQEFDQPGAPSKPATTKKRLDSGAAAGIIATLAVVVLTVSVFIGISLWGTPGEKGVWLRDLSKTARKATDAEATGAMRNGPYETVDLASIQQGAYPKYRFEYTLFVVNAQHSAPASYVPKLVKVPFEHAKALEETGEAYRGINIAVNNKFGTPIDLDAAYLDPASKEGMQPQNVDNTLGLALDFKAPSYKLENFANSPKGRYIDERAADFGLILRYPKDKEDKTGIPYTPYKYRYVGYPHAQIMKAEHLCLDEYPEFLGVDREYDYSGFVVSRQKGPQLKIPKSAVEAHVAADNTGYYLVVARMPAVPDPQYAPGWGTENGPVKKGSAIERSAQERVGRDRDSDDRDRDRRGDERGGDRNDERRDERRNDNDRRDKKKDAERNSAKKDGSAHDSKKGRNDE